MTALSSEPSAPLPSGAEAEATRRRLSARQAEVVATLVAAAEEETEAVGYEGLTVRGVARRAGVAPATAYTYFSSKDHLLAEALWRRLDGLDPVEVDLTLPASVRVGRAVAELIPFAVQRPALRDACTLALVSSNPDVAHLRDRIGALTHRRLVAALGEGVDPRIARVLEVTYAGALLTAGIGHLSFLEVPGFLAETTALLLSEAA